MTRTTLKTSFKCNSDRHLGFITLELIDEEDPTLSDFAYCSTCGSIYRTETILEQLGKSHQGVSWRGGKFEIIDLIDVTEKVENPK